MTEKTAVTAGWFSIGSQTMTRLFGLQMKKDKTLENQYEPFRDKEGAKKLSPECV
jgi:hypothetical protein